MMLDYSTSPRLEHTWFRCVVAASSFMSWYAYLPGFMKIACPEIRKRSLLIIAWTKSPVYSS